MRFVVPKSSMVSPILDLSYIYALVGVPGHTGVHPATEPEVDHRGIEEAGGGPLHRLDRVCVLCLHVLQDCVLSRTAKLCV